MTDVCEGIKDILVIAGVANFADDEDNDPANTWSMFINKMPGKPLKAIGITKSGGKAPNPKYLIDYPSVQVMVRGEPNGAVDAEAKASEIKDALLGREAADLNGDRWVAINMISDIAPLGFDTNNCPLYSVNFSLIIEPAASDLTNRISL